VWLVEATLSLCGAVTFNGFVRVLMVEIKFEVAEPTPTCGAPSSKSKTAMHCELPPDHKELYHNGRNRRGAWRAWPLDDFLSKSLFRRPKKRDD